MEARSESNYVSSGHCAKSARAAGAVITRVSANIRPDRYDRQQVVHDIWLKTSNPNMPRMRVAVTIEIRGRPSVNPNTGGASDRSRRRRDRQQGHPARPVTPFRINRH